MRLPDSIPAACLVTISWPSSISRSPTKLDWIDLIQPVHIRNCFLPVWLRWAAPCWYARVLVLLPHCCLC
jgi:hypothetical protein